jgi:hypothetical protein
MLMSGGVIGEPLAPKRAHLAVMREINDFAATLPDNGYSIDIAFWTGDGPLAPGPVGITAGKVGRTDPRFIVWHRPPLGLDTVSAVRAWMIDLLPHTAKLVRDHLPTKSRALPAVDLALEVLQLRRHLLELQGRDGVDPPAARRDDDPQRDARHEVTSADGSRLARNRAWRAVAGILLRRPLD